MSDIKEPVIVEDRDKLAYLIDQEKIVRQTSKAVTEIEDQNFILTENEEVVSLRNLTCDKERDSEDFIEFLEEFPSEMTDLWHKLSLWRIEQQVGE